MTRAERVDGRSLIADARALAAVAGRFAEGAIAVYPTETIYGLGGRADWPSVEQRVAAVKGRPSDKSMLVVAATPEMFGDMGLVFSPAAQRLAERFWPGPLTLVLPTSDGVFRGVRVSNHPFIRAIGRYLPQPLISTSANLSGHPYDASPERIYATLASRIDFMVDYGELPPSLPSTVVRVAGDSVEVLRQGAVSLMDLTAVLKGIAVVTRDSEGA